MAEIPAPEPARPTTLADSVLLIDGDNDPHLPPEFAVTPNTLVRVFLRPGAKMPRPLERKLDGLPLCITVVSPKGGANAADFVMSMHTGILHATLPLNLPFTLVTHDKSLAVMVEELQRVGRQAILWTSHPERSAPRTRTASGGRRPARGRRATSRPPAAAVVPVPPPPAPAAIAAETPAAPLPGAPETNGNLVSVAAAYAQRLGRIKDPPSRLKTLLNDITHRTGNSGLPAEVILEELKRAHGLAVDANGHVTVPALSVAAAPAEAAAPAPRPHRRRRRRR